MLGAGLALALAAPTAEATFPGRNGRIAFTNFEYSAEDNSYESRIIGIRPDGSAPRVLAAGRPEYATYRPDGHMIAFARPKAGIFLMRSDGSAKRRLLAGPYAQPDWSPDGRRLVVTRTRRPAASSSGTAASFARSRRDRRRPGPPRERSSPSPAPALSM